ncbi:MAG: AmmeMemoRadiSam system protein B [Terriglobia bacterium]
MPAVAGRFYPSRPEDLAKAVDQHLSPEAAHEEVLTGAKACVAPHAGYMYSGHVAGAVYRRLPPSKSFVILCPNHSGRGEPLAIMTHGAWRTPLGDVPVNGELAGLIRHHCEFLVEDETAHAQEHSLEVQLPFLQRRMKSFSFVPIALGGVAFETLVTLGRLLASALREFAKPAFVIASSDMNHYEPDEVTRIKDHRAITEMLRLDAQGLYDTVLREKITMCGYGAAVATFTAMKALGATEANLVKYATSADAGGDARSVVGYAAIVIR